ncbi:hypothetical protein BDK51DRAFT_53284 [Blyttiomyces helicus]|uniref:Uncharacterized protein n=1 Tax=Blyttiomyces helicus TaxID=388810 RepID=A0A4P9WNF2_9FUNG|nr:hypothetical protein BDK51DRAFT_53284 [Blyttiomyces helicus]|eukprot:RKO93805.1 hypothetical protein BDK51DRAFT_53284 [Blyttiomyces helicus]
MRSILTTHLRFTLTATETPASRSAVKGTPILIPAQGVAGMAGVLIAARATRADRIIDCDPGPSRSPFNDEQRSPREILGPFTATTTRSSYSGSSIAAPYGQEVTLYLTSKYKFTEGCKSYQLYPLVPCSAGEGDIVTDIIAATWDLRAMMRRDFDLKVLARGVARVSRVEQRLRNAKSSARNAGQSAENDYPFACSEGPFLSAFASQSRRRRATTHRQQWSVTTTRVGRAPGGRLFYIRPPGRPPCEEGLHQQSPVLNHYHMYFSSGLPHDKGLATLLEQVESLRRSALVSPPLEDPDLPIPLNPLEQPRENAFPDPVPAQVFESDILFKREATLDLLRNPLSSPTLTSSPSTPSSASEPQIDDPPDADSAASRALKRVTMDELAICASCGARIGILVLHGCLEDVGAPHVATIRCMDCERAAISLTPPPPWVVVEPSVPPVGKRKLARPIGPGPLDCSACERELGVGGMRLIAEDSNGARCWFEPNFQFELLCTACHEMFKFCTEVGSVQVEFDLLCDTSGEREMCSGGTRHRSGQYRPKQLFAAGRRTCNLSHQRQTRGHEYHYEVTQIPLAAPSVPNIDPNTLIALMESFAYTKYVDVVAKPKYMFYTGLDTWEKLEAHLVAATASLLVMTSPPPPGTRRYYAIAWAVSASSASQTRKKHRKDAAAVPWGTDGRRASIDGIVCLHVDPTRGTVFATSTVSAAAMRQRVLSVLLATTLQKILADVEVGEPPLQHLWVFDLKRRGVDSAETAALSPTISPFLASRGIHHGAYEFYRIWEGSGFLPLDEYLRSISMSIPSSIPPAREWFDLRMAVPPPLLPLYEVFVVGVKSYLQKGGGA